MIVQHVRSCLPLSEQITPGYEEPRTLYRHHQLIREHLRVIAYHHVADSYVALFSHFIPCGTWVESYNGFSQWIFFGGEGIIAENDPEEQEKIIKYNDFVANAMIFQNVMDVSQTLRELIAEGYPVNRADVAALSPYLTRHIKRFGDYFIDLSVLPQPLTETALALSL